MKSSRLSRKSPIQVALLSMGTKGPISIIEARKMLEHHFRDHEWIPHRGVIYPALKKLHEDGLIIITDSHGLKSYHTTPKGLTELLRLIDYSISRLDNDAEFILLTISQFIEMDPDSAQELLEQLLASLNQLIEKVEHLKIQASQARQEWVDIKLED